MTPQQMLGIVIFLDILTVCFACLRFWILKGKKRSTIEKWSDGFFALAVIISTANVCGVCYKLTEEIKLRKDKDMTPFFLEYKLFAPRFLKMVYIFGIAYIIELYFLKAAFILFYWELFKSMDSRRKYTLFAAAALVICSFVATILLYVLWANPISDNWSANLFLVIRKAALASWAVNTAGAWMHIGTDLTILTLPLLILSTLRLRRPEVFALIFVFCMGGLSIAASVTRYAIIYPYIKRPPLTNRTVHLLELWGVVEICAAVFAFSLPSLRVMYARIFPTKKPKQISSGNSNKPSGSGSGRRSISEATQVTTWTIGGGVINHEGIRMPTGVGARKMLEKKQAGAQPNTWESEVDVELRSLEVEEETSSLAGENTVASSDRGSQERLQPSIAPQDGSTINTGTSSLGIGIGGYGWRSTNKETSRCHDVRSHGTKPKGNNFEPILQDHGGLLSQ